MALLPLSQLIFETSRIAGSSLLGCALLAPAVEAMRSAHSLRASTSSRSYKRVSGAPQPLNREKTVKAGYREYTRRCGGTSWRRWLGEPFFGRALVGALVRVAIKRAYILAEVLQALEREPGTYRRAPVLAHHSFAATPRHPSRAMHMCMRWERASAWGSVSTACCLA